MHFLLSSIRAVFIWYLCGRALSPLKELYMPRALPRTQTSLSRQKCARKGRREGDIGRDVASPAVCTLSMVPCDSSPVARHYLAKNEAPEEEAATSCFFLSLYPFFKVSPWQESPSILISFSWLIQMADCAYKSSKHGQSIKSGFEQLWDFHTRVISSEQVRFLRNCPPTPPLSQHFALSEK